MKNLNPLQKNLNPSLKRLKKSQKKATRVKFLLKKVPMLRVNFLHKGPLC